MVKKIAHIGIAVKNLEQAVKFYEEEFGLKVTGIEEVPEQKVKVAFLPVGDTKIELLESTSADGPVARFIEKKGEGVHHIAFMVDNLEQVLSDFKHKGIPLIDETPRDGAGGVKIAFIHPKATFGTLIEVCERK